MAQDLCSNRSCELRGRCYRYLGYADDTAQRYRNYAQRPKLPTGECAGWISVTGLATGQYRRLSEADLANYRMDNAEVVS